MTIENWTEAGRDVHARFGGDHVCDVADEELVLGDVLMADGFTPIPNAFFRYGRVMRLRPSSWFLLAQLQKHAWYFNTLAYPSVRKLARSVDAGYSTLLDHLGELRSLQYVRRVSQGKGMDHRARDDIRGLYYALACCVAADPSSRYNRDRLPITLEALERSQGNVYTDDSRVYSFLFDLESYEDMIRREQEPDEE